MEFEAREIWNDPCPRVFAPPHLEAEGRSLEAALRRVGWAECGVVFASSGSGGGAKWILHTQDSLLHSARVVNRHLGVTREDCWGLALPSFHVGGFGVLARVHVAGCRVEEFRDAWDPPGFVNRLRATGTTHLSLVPTQVFDLVDAGLPGPDSLRAVVVGGGGLAVSLGRQARDLGWPVLQSYGMTEAGSQVATEGMDALAAEFSGASLPVLPDWELRVDETGRLGLRGPALFDCYVEMDGGEARRIEAAEDGWFSSTDLVELRNGLLTFLGRCDRVVKILGELVNLAKLETQLGVVWNGRVECRVVALEDPRTGWRLVPVFQGELPADVPDRLAEINSSLPGFSRLGSPSLVASWPRTPIGKIDFAELTSLVAARGFG